MAPRPSPPPSAHPEVEAASTPDASMVEAYGTTKTGPSSSMPPPPPAGFSPPSQVEPDASTGGTAVTSLTVSSASADEDDNASRTEMTDAVPPERQQPRPRAPYAIPDWSAAPEHPFFLEVVEEGISYGVLDVSKKGAYMFGQSGVCDFVLDHSSIARFHAVLQFRNDGEVFLYDLGSTHGSSINKTQIKKKIYTKILVGHFIQFGLSPRLYFFQGPSELIPPVDVAGNAGGDKEMASAAPPEQQQQQHKPPQRAPYAIPNWSATPEQPFFLQVLKNGICLEKLDVSKKGAYMFGRADPCDFVLDDPSVSGFHAVLQFRNDGDAFLYDLGSIDGSSINKTQIKKKMYTKIHVGDLIQFGQSSRLYLLQGPSELMPPNTIIPDREASLSREKTHTALAEWISCCMSEDAPEESGEDEADEIMWQTYKGDIHEKTRSNIIKRMEKIARMKKETDAIRDKENSQGGLTQGQQTKIARNEQIASQIMVEIINLQETLSDSIQASLGARAQKRKRGSHKASIEEEDVSDDGEFYDRTKKRLSNQQSSGHQSVQTADSLLEKKDSITHDIEGKKKLLEEEKNKLAQSHDADFEDEFDAYMSGLSSQLARDNITKIQKELTNLQAELDTVVYLLKVADPMEEAAHKRNLKPREANPQAFKDNPKPESKKQEFLFAKKTSTDENSKDPYSIKTQVDKPAEIEIDVSRNGENASKPAFSVPKQWLGDKRTTEPEDDCLKEANANADEPDNFVEYKDRRTLLSNSVNRKDLEEAAPGLILRKRKSAEQTAGIETEPSLVESKASAADVVAFVLKHKRGLQISEEMDNESNPQAKGKGSNSKQKRLLGPARPDSFEAVPD